MESIGKKYDIDKQLSGVLSHFYVIKVQENEPSQIHHLSPSLEMMVVFNFDVPVSFSFGEMEIAEHTIERIGILGPLRKMMNYELTGGADLLILPFIYDGFYRFLSLPLDGFEAGVLKEEDVAIYTQRLEEVWQMLSLITDPEKRIEKLTAYLLDNIFQNDPAIMLIKESVPDIHNPSLNPVKVIAGRASLTERTIQLRFKKYVGYSPKELIRFLRFKQVLSFILERPKEKIDWFELIVQYGYHDQSHLIKDFKYYIGVSPKQFIKLNEEGNFCVNRE